MRLGGARCPKSLRLIGEQSRGAVTPHSPVPSWRRGVPPSRLWKFPLSDFFEGPLNGMSASHPLFSPPSGRSPDDGKDNS